MSPIIRYKLVFFVPRANTRSVLDKLFEKCPRFVGKIGDYEHCAFITPGTGQFKPVGDANPTIGSVGQVESVEEDRVEVVVNDQGQQEEIKTAIEELKKVHPYEEVAYDVYRVEGL
ncbi:hypothetical protein CC1G_06833 [Coprinopsis cinerea okayama7|uniref:ATP phosphoribosyltransferase n=1 Tax=Coprinopsis cinerea (strain Okayama-7 / 130 / ATCC MYA-4618 / FGSC 9003) TaxID=240176 RepID=A8N6W1_COPC7|nr:hypothetical protein CC1G_06833 [Coprinopsis cinerea okayama7\|eukprot:XP_001830567.2 hypothetical protein CC1G_06833 [Coprinopsis cinerea okayama7\